MPIAEKRDFSFPPYFEPQGDKKKAMTTLPRWSEPERHRIVESLSALARHLGLARSTVHGWAISGQLPARKDGRYSTRQVAAWLRQRENEWMEAEVRGAGERSPELEKLRRVMRQLKELELREATGELVRGAPLAAEYREVCAGIRTRMTNVPGRLALEVQGQPLDRIRAIMEREFAAVSEGIEAVAAQWARRVEACKARASG